MTIPSSNFDFHSDWRYGLLPLAAPNDAAISLDNTISALQSLLAQNENPDLSAKILRKIKTIKPEGEKMRVFHALAEFLFSDSAAASAGQRLNNDKRKRLSNTASTTLEFNNGKKRCLSAKEKALLILTSPFFENLFEGNFREANQQTAISFELCSYEEFNELLHVITSIEEPDAQQACNTLVLCNRFLSSHEPSDQRLRKEIDSFCHDNPDHYLAALAFAEIINQAPDIYPHDIRNKLADWFLKEAANQRFEKREEIIRLIQKLEPIALKIPKKHADEDFLLHVSMIKSLISLDLKDCKEITDVGLKHIAALSNLASLDLSFCRITDVSLAAITGNLVNLTSFNLWGCGKVSDEGLSHITALSNLTSLNLSHCDRITDDGLAAIAGKLVNLTSLDLIWCWKISDTGFSYITALSNLTSLNLSFCRITDASLAAITGNLVNLTSLNLSECWMISDAGLIHITALSNLTRLNLSGGSKISDAGLAVIADNLVNLTWLNLSGCCRITDAGLKHIVRLFMLASLYLRKCSNITDAGLKHIAALSNLTSLDLSFCQITNDGLAAIAGSHVNLASLDLIGCCLITDAGLASLADSLVNLTSFNLSRCYKITDAGLASIGKLLKLTWLNLSDCVLITDAGLVLIAELPMLASLYLKNCRKITTDDIKCIVKPRLLILQ